MYRKYLSVIALLCGLSFALVASVPAAEADTNARPDKVYVPYDKLKGVFETQKQGVFLPYEDFQKLWRAAQGRPRDVSEAPFEYLISTARFKGNVKDELADFQLQLTIDILTEGWADVPIGLGEVGVKQAKFLKQPKDAKIKPLLRLTDSQYILTAKGKGRYVLALDFVRQLQSKPGLKVLDYRIPSAAVTTLELMIPQENLQVDVKPMLAATTSQIELDTGKATRMQAFLGSAKKVHLSWKPKTEAAAELEPVVVCEQFQHINISEALINYQVKLNYTIRRGGIETFSVQLPGGFRVTDVSGANISKWDIEAVTTPAGEQKRQILKVQLFSAAKGQYVLTVQMERFLQQAEADFALVPVSTEGLLRQNGLIGITWSPRRLVSLEQIKNLARVDTGRLPSNLRNQSGVTAYRFIGSDYSAVVSIKQALPRITVKQYWALGVESDRLHLQGKMRYKVERTGIFELQMNFPEPWEIEDVGPDQVVDDYQLKGKGPERLLHILLNKENTGEFELTLTARAERAGPEAPVDFNLPLADAKNLQLYQGQLMLLVPDHLSAEVQKTQQLHSIPLKQAEVRPKMKGVSAVMAFEFRAVDRAKPAGAGFRIAIKPPQVSAVVYQLVNVQQGSIEHEAIINYKIRYAPVDTFYLKMPQEFADAGVQISGRDIKEKPRINELPAEQRSQDKLSEKSKVKWAYYKIVLQSKKIGSYQLKVRAYRAFQAGRVGQAKNVQVPPILAAGKLSEQIGRIAIAKAQMLAVGQPESSNLTPADPGSSDDLPYRPHRRAACMAFRYNTGPFALSFVVVTQKEAAVFTTIATGVIIEQVLGLDGTLNTHATYLLQTSKGNRVPITLPSDAELTAVLLNGNEAPVEMGVETGQRIVRLPPSAGQVSRLVMEISYGLKNASGANLTAPSLPDEIPVQQTLWRLWIPKDHYLLGHSRNFSRLNRRQCQNMIGLMAGGQPSRVAFKLPSQGKDFSFVRQGGPGRLSVMAAGKEVFSVVIWALVIAAGFLMLKLSGFHRLMIILSLGLVGGIVHLYQPLLIIHTVEVGVFAAILVLLLWVSQWGFLRLPKIRATLGAGGEPKTESTEAQKNVAAGEEKKEQPKKEQE